LHRPKDALKEVKLALRQEPKRWELYARAARLFVAIENEKSALAMLDHAERCLANQPLPVDEASRTKQASIKRGLKQLRQQANALSDIILGRSICHIAKLPVEMLESVFALLVYNEQRYTVLLSHVCIHWRALCLSNPSFWYTLKVEAHFKILVRIHEVLKRSHNRITHLDLAQGVHLTHRGILQTHLGSLQWNALRKLSIVTDGRIWSQLRVLLAEACDAGYTGNLVELSISAGEGSRNVTLYDHSIDGLREDGESKAHEDTTDNSADEEEEMDPQMRSQVRHLTVTGCCFNHVDTVRAYHDLLSLRLKDYLWEPEDLDLVGFLCRSPNLESIALEGTYRITIAPRENVLTFTKLTALRATITPSVSHLLHCIDVPNLVVLDLRSTAPHHHLVYAIALLSANMGLPCLEELHIQHCAGIDAGHLRKLFANSPRIRTLQLSHITQGVKDVVTWLGRADQGKIPCPRLKHANFSDCPDITTSPLVALVKAHLPQPSPQSGTSSSPTDCPLEDSKEEYRVTPLSSLIVDGCPLIEAEALPWFKDRLKTFSCRYMTKKQATYKR
jgi:F-box/TPR repeat protein Pof3